MQRTTIFFIVFLVMTCARAEVLTNSAFIKEAVMNNPSYRISAQQYYSAVQANRAAHSLDDWNLIASSFYQDSSPAPISPFSAEHQQTLGYSVGAERYFSSSGTAFSLEHSNTRISAQYPPAISIPGIGTLDFNPPPKYYLSSVSLTIVQPLLKNAFGLAAKEGLKISDLSLKLARLKLNEDWEDFITMLKGEYLNWQRCHKNVDLLDDKVEKASDQLKLVTRQIKYGLSENLDVVQLKQKEKTYRILLEQAKLACETATRKILLLCGRKDNTYNEIKPEDFKLNGQVMEETQAFEYLASASTVNRLTDLTVELSASGVRIKEDEEKMGLDLVLNAKPNAFTQGAGDSLTQLGSYNDYTFTLSASRPLSNTKAEAEARQARNELEKARKQKEQVLLNARIGLTALYTSLKYLNHTVSMNEDNLKLARERFELERKRFNQGRSSVFFVLQAEDDLLQAENLLNETVFAREAVINQINSITDRYQIEYAELMEAGEK